MPSDLERATRGFGAELERGPVGQAQGALLDAWAGTYLRTLRTLDVLTERMKAAEDAGRPVKPWWLAQEASYNALLRQVAVEVTRYAANAAVITDDGIAATVPMAVSHADQLGLLALESHPTGVAVEWATLPTAAVQQMTAHLTADRSPLKALLARLGPDAAALVRRELLAGVALGHHPGVIARRIREALARNPVRAVTIARTEMQRAYREATRQAFLANRGVLKGWVWIAARSNRTCAACWAMHGSFHTLDERLDGHPRCRCAMMPDTKGEGGPVVPPGSEAFEELERADRLAVLGPSKLDAYERGRIGLGDLVERTNSSRWGTMRREASLGEAVKNHAG